MSFWCHRFDQKTNEFFFKDFCPSLLTDGIFETGAYGVPSKSQNPTILDQGFQASTQWSHLIRCCHWVLCLATMAILHLGAVHKNFNLVPVATCPKHETS